MTMCKNLSLIFLSMCLCGTSLQAQDEPFAKRTVKAGLNSPWEITYGPNDSIWVTENVSYLVKRIHVGNGGATTLLDLSTQKNFSPNDGGRWPQGGLMGMAIHPNLYSSSASDRASKPWVYLAYVYSRPTGQGCSNNANDGNPCNFRTRIVRYNYSGNSLSGAVTVLDNIPGSNDHNSGRLVIGPDLKLYYTIGDLGAGQFNNSSRTNSAQAIDVMEGKILRLNSEPDNDGGVDDWIPNDNPYYNNSTITARDYVYSMGHRNAQGIVWGNVGGTNRLYSSEHGDKTDDELNLITAGSNYGWNQVSGYCDDNYNGLTLGGNSSVNEGNFCTATTANRAPMKSLFYKSKSAITAMSGDYLSWPTVAPSSIDLYSANKIPGWENSLLIPCLKAGKVFRVRLDAAGTGLATLGHGLDTASYFRGQGRFRDVAISPDGLKIFVACDASGQTSGPTGGFNNGGAAPPNAGAILEFAYTGTVLPIREPSVVQPQLVEKHIRIFPNPVEDWMMVSVTLDAPRPFTIQIFTATGERVRELKTRASETRVNMADVQPGLYFIQIRNAAGQLLKTEKFVRGKK